MQSLALRLLRLYKRWISPAFPPSCRYTPTCSQYAMEAIERYGALRGTMKAAWRVLRCHPLAKGGLDPVVKGGLDPLNCRSNDCRSNDGRLSDSRSNEAPQSHVILSGVSASQREAITQSKDPYTRPRIVLNNEMTSY